MRGVDGGIPPSARLGRRCIRLGNSRGRRRRSRGVDRRLGGRGARSRTTRKVVSYSLL